MYAVMKAPFTERQGEFLAFIYRFTVHYGAAPSFEQIADHFGVSSPSVNGMIKTLERRGLLSRVPGVARSLRVLVPTSLLPESEFGSGSRAHRSMGARRHDAAAVPPVDMAVTAAIAVLEVLLPNRQAADKAAAVLQAANAVHSSLAKMGLGDHEALVAARRVAAEVSRWHLDGRGTFAHRRRWVKR
jgi:repressor LexA